MAETSSSPSVGRLQKAISGTCSCPTLSQHHWASYLASLLIGLSLWLLENDSTQMGNDLTIASHLATWLLENDSTQMGNDLTSKPQGKRDELAEF